MSVLCDYYRALDDFPALLGALEILGWELLLGAEDSEGAKLGVWLGAVDKLGCELRLGAEDSEG